MSIHLKQPQWIAAPLMILWLCAMVYAFWWFQVRDLRSFDANAAHFFSDQAQMFDVQRMTTVFGHLQIENAANSPAKALVVHFWNPDCDCNRFNAPHVRRIIDTYAQQDIRFVTVAASSGQNPQTILDEAKRMFGVPAVLAEDITLDLSAMTTTPAAAVITSNGELVYYGPYSDSAFCGANGSAFVEKVLDKMLAGQAVTSQKSLAFGCFCPWRTADVNNEQPLT